MVALLVQSFPYHNSGGNFGKRTLSPYSLVFHLECGPPIREVREAIGRATSPATTLTPDPQPWFADGHEY
jgi:hypothetical protein